jgi:predicted Zn-dependent peptidase
MSELTRISREPVPQDELARIKAYVRGTTLLSMEGTAQVASWLGGQECLRGKIIDVDEVLQQIDAITPDDIQRVAQQCFAPEWRRLALIGPFDPQHAVYFGKLLKGGD